MSVSYLPLLLKPERALAKLGTGQADENFHPFVKPSDALGVFTQSLDRRFDGMDEGFCSKLLDAMKSEDSKLRTFIEKAQLELWYRATRDCAEKTVADAYNRLTEARTEVVHNGNGDGNGNGKWNGSANSLFRGATVNKTRPSLFGV